MPISAKMLAYLWILSCYFIGIWLKLFCTKFALHWTNIKVISWKENFNGSPVPNLFDIKKASLYRVKFPNSLTCLKLTITSLEMFRYNNIKVVVKLQTSVTKQRYLLPLLNERQCMDTVILHCHFFSFLLLLSYETKYHSSHID